ncbi:MAG: RsfS/YbeB/iojap family protein, partial [Bacteroidaceae bacterium]|nr:RsfS/YbeB/iojap family protein [Bacteroidaceae bacterium]
GLRNSLWVAMDYEDIMVHIFVPEWRSFYDLDNLWEDADTTDIPNAE